MANKNIKYIIVKNNCALMECYMGGQLAYFFTDKKDSRKMKKWLLEYVNPLHNVFRRFGDNNIDRGFTRTIEVPEELIRG